MDDAESQDTARMNAWLFEVLRRDVSTPFMLRQLVDSGVIEALPPEKKPLSPRDSALLQAMEYLDLAIAEIEDGYQADVVENAVRNALDALIRAGVERRPPFLTP